MPARPPKPCLDCRRLTHTSRCPDCERNRRRTMYDNPQWRAISRATRAAQPACAVCGSTIDLTCDHVAAGSLTEGVQTLCRKHNGAKGDR